MARQRSIKPGFFSNEYLADLPYQARLLFIGLWLVADREGRLEDRPRRLQSELFPYDPKINVDDLLQKLATQAVAPGESPFIIRYAVEGGRYIFIPGFKFHQNPHKNEKESIIPPAPSNIATFPDKNNSGQEMAQPCPADYSLQITDFQVMDLDQKSPTPQKEDKIKLLYGSDNVVKLTKKEFEQLTEKVGPKQRDGYIERLNNYIMQIGPSKAAAKYKSHYHTILNWWRRDGEPLDRSPIGIPTKVMEERIKERLPDELKDIDLNDYPGGPSCKCGGTSAIFDESGAATICPHVEIGQIKKLLSQ